MSKIMIVDDSRLARTLTATCLRKQGHQVQEVDPSSIFDVVKDVKEGKPDLLIMDYVMPHCPGASLAKVCLEDPGLNTMQMLVLTAHRDTEVTGHLVQLGVAEVMYKPFEPRALVDTVRQILDRPTRR